MNRKQRIIVSITGIFLVLLILLGLTYAYFATQIIGNKEEESISLSIANLAIVYGDGNGYVIGSGETVLPGKEFNPKTFTVTNKGNDITDYVVVIDNSNITYATTIEINGETQTAGEEATLKYNDFTYTLDCTSYENYGEENQIESGTCTGVSEEGSKLPVTGGILVKNTVDIGITHVYSLKVKYEETDVDQTEDMNKKIEARINIADPDTFNPYKTDKGSLAYTIIDNAVGLTGEEKTLGYAELVEKPYTKVAEEISGETESVITTTPDDYGISYYYRGNVENNYLTFNNGNNDTCWRIVRIEGDGSIKIVLADSTAGCGEATLTKTDSAYIGTGDYGYKKNYNAVVYDYLEAYNQASYDNSVDDNNIARTSSMKYKFNIFLNGGEFDSYDSSYNTITKTYTAWSADAKAKLKTTTACIGDATTKYDHNGVITTDLYDYRYDSSVRLLGIGQTANATLKCNASGGKTSETQIFPLTADEIVFAGGKAEYENNTYYLRENATTGYWWTLSLSHYFGDDGSDLALVVIDAGSVEGDFVYNHNNLRPAVSLIAGTQFASGDGSINNPYTIK